MGKVANEKRKAFFAALAERDGVAKPTMRTNEPKIELEAVPAVDAKNCCMTKFGTMPTNFTACVDCPLEK